MVVVKDNKRFYLNFFILRNKYPYDNKMFKTYRKMTIKYQYVYMNKTLKAVACDLVSSQTLTSSG